MRVRSPSALVAAGAISIVAAGAILLFVSSTVSPVVSAPAGTGHAVSTPGHVLTGQTPDVVVRGTAKLRRHHDPHDTLTLDISLGIRNKALFEALFAASNNPASPQYRHYLTNAQYLAMFAPTARQVRAVRTWSASVGLTVQAVSPDHLLVTVRGPTAVVERALGVTVNDYSLGRQVFMSNDRDPVVPAGLDIEAISGLSTIHRFHPLLPRGNQPAGA